MQAMVVTEAQAPEDAGSSVHTDPSVSFSPKRSNTGSVLTTRGAAVGSPRGRG